MFGLSRRTITVALWTSPNSPEIFQLMGHLFRWVSLSWHRSYSICWCFTTGPVSENPTFFCTYTWPTIPFWRLVTRSFYFDLARLKSGPNSRLFFYFYQKGSVKMILIWSGNSALFFRSFELWRLCGGRSNEKREPIGFKRRNVK